MLATIAKSRFPEFATDLISTPTAGRFVSAADVEYAKRVQSQRVPTRNAKGQRFSSIYDTMKSEKKAQAFADAHGWPFVCHLSNIIA